MGTDAPDGEILRIDHLTVPLASGISLAGRLWRPAGADQDPVPAIVDYHPYRSSDGSAPADEAIYARLASRGYACVKLDVRGTGNSDGLHPDQFDAAYWTDAVEALAWIAAQPWCNGRTGMTGLSWPAHASLMVATRQPASLGAILPVDGADDRYLNRYQGGCLLVYAVWHGAQLSGMHLRPPLPWVVGERWREMWLQRLSAYRNYFELWGAHPTFGAYWHAGSAKRDFDRIACPILATVGWADTGYAVALPTLLRESHISRSVVAGPWGHCFPHTARPGPGFDFVELAARWFDHTLKGGTPSEWPRLMAWLIESHEPSPDLMERPGYWVEEGAWPPDSVKMQRYGLAPGRLGIDLRSDIKAEVRSPLTVGATSGEWMPWYPAGSGAHLAEDQREADGLSLCFDREPVVNDTELLGQPVLSLAVSSDRPCGQIVARLCDVAPDGTSTRVTYGFLNLSHREGDEHPVTVEPGQGYEVKLALAPIGWCLKPGHRLRLAISTSYFPIIWPAPHHATLTLDLARCELRLPLRKAGHRCAPPAPSIVMNAPALAASVLRAPKLERRRSFDVGSSLLETVVDEDNGEIRLEKDGLTFGSTMKRTYSIVANDPLSACCTTSAVWTLGRADWSTRVTVDAIVTSSDKNFFVDTLVSAHEGENEVYGRQYRKVVPRGSA
ncbi:CocE/NonD family hydrolase [Bradyrhizobium sp. CCBAU 53338]|uniref:CocE/NonD family hydrolase n=1 Tax=Bradyrhizobium sp. CCBAU 53338 TaxID=1325111 RepID=UPI0018C085A4|nr:CocE/NonD family hydrolase [Bradyrhizobium sp. CCBAU 53338]QOZ51458.1 peptidase S15 [Bradyrhizobium sp. CCBAU 53338]